MDKIYRTVPLTSIPWIFETPPRALIELVDNGKVKPCKTIDLGCGTGNNALYLVSRGFDVTGIDISPSAIRIAKENSANKGIKSKFVVADVLGSLSEIKDVFNFAYDWELLHHIFPEDREKYFKNVYKLLKQGGKYLSVCFSEEDTQFKGSGKYHETKVGTILYFSSEEEIRELLMQCFNILELKTIKIRGKSGPHVAIHAFVEKE